MTLEERDQYAMLQADWSPAYDITHHPGAARPFQAIPRDGTAAIRVTISIGIAVPSQARRTLDDLLAAADHALYQAKSSGRDRVVIYADTWVPQASRPLPLARTNVVPG